MDLKKQATTIICLSKVNGGMELAAVKLARLLSQDMPVHFIARESGFLEKERVTHFSNYDISLHTIKFSSSFGYALMSQSRKLLKEHAIKNIVFLGASEMKSLHFAALGLDINFIIRQGSKKSTPKKDWFHTLVYKDVDSFVGNCEYIKNNIQEIIPLAPQTKLTRIYASLQLQDLQRQEKTSKRLELINVGRINPVKGQLEVIRACQGLHENNIDFRLQLLGDVQDKEYHQEILEYLEGSSYKDKVELVGYTSDVPSYLIQADIFAFPTLGEGMSNAIIESLGYGLIPIIYDNSSSSEFVDLGFHLHLVQDGQKKEFADTLLQCAQNFSKERLHIDSNMELARRVFNPQREKQEYLALLK